MKKDIKTKTIDINGIPAIIWGKKSKKAYMYVHGKMGSKEDAKTFAEIAQEKGYQTVSFDLPEHGERKTSFYKCDIYNCIKDTNIVAEYILKTWNTVSLMAVSLGAQISLQCFKDLKSDKFEKTHFMSPITNMNYLIQQMFTWFNITEEMLKAKKIINTPVDTMTIDQFNFYKENPVTKWPFKTNILFAAKDNMQTYEIQKNFTDTFGGTLTVSENSEHPFMKEEDGPIVKKWFEENII